jgi:hypothetical protein
MHFSLDWGSPSLTIAPTFTAADILASWGLGAFWAYAPWWQLGLAWGDDLDALCLWDETNPEYFGPGDVAWFSLTRGSPTLATIGASAADILQAVGGGPPLPIVVADAFSLGLDPTVDDLDALKCYTPPKDTDADGLPDGWELTYWLNLSQGPAGDPDGDGATNLDEFNNGTNPTNPDTDADGFRDKPEDDYENPNSDASEDNCPTVSNPGQANFDAGDIDNGPGIAQADATMPSRDYLGDACDADDDNDQLSDVEDVNPIGGIGICSAFAGSSDGHGNPARGDNTNDDNGNGDPAPNMGTDAADNGPSWDTDNDGYLDGYECLHGSNPRNLASTPAALPGDNADTDGDGLLNAWERAHWRSSHAMVDSNLDGWGDCVEAVDTDGNGVLDFGSDALNSARAALLPAGIGPGTFGKTMDFDLDGNGIIDFGADTLTVARMSLGIWTCK